MKRLFSYVMALAVGAMLLTGSAWAWDATEHVTVSPGGKGDAGVFPIWLAYEGWETKLEIINTDDQYSTVAKVIVRSAKNSQEVLDFLVYLSPTDVWTGYLRWGVAGPELFSNDDSVLAGTRATGPIEGKWANVDPAMPMRVTLFKDCDDVVMGYVEVVEGRYWSLGKPPVAKSDIYAKWKVLGGGLPGTLNSLAMHYEISYIPAPGFKAAERAVVFRDYEVTSPKLTLGDQTYIGSDFFTPSRNSFCEVEAALSKNYIAMPYYANGSPFESLHILTFSTKNTQLDKACKRTGVLGPFFQQNNVGDYCVEYGRYFWNLEEDSPSSPGSYSPIPPSQIVQICDEVVFLDPQQIVGTTTGFDEGWILYAFDEVTSCAPESGLGSISFTGAPVIPTTVLYDNFGMSFLYGAWSDGNVVYTPDVDENYLFYHYGPFPRP